MSSGGDGVVAAVAVIAGEVPLGYRFPVTKAADEQAPPGLDKQIFDAAAEGNKDDLVGLCQQWSGHPVIDAFRKDDLTALHVVAKRGDAYMVRLLIAANADLTHANSSGSTALHFAAENNEAEAVRILLAEGASLTAKDIKGRTPLELARELDQIECVDILKDAAERKIKLLIERREKVALESIASLRLDNDDEARDFLLLSHFPSGLVRAFFDTKKKFSVHIFIIDNSQSMSEGDSVRIVGGTNSKTAKMDICSRWQECQDMIKFHTDLAEIDVVPVEFRFLNDFEPIIVGTGGLGRAKLAEALDSSPSGGTPLCKHICAFRTMVETKKDELIANDRMAMLTIATDGESSDGNVVDELRPLGSLPCRVVVRLCTEDTHVQEYWREVSAQVSELRIELIDVFHLEAAKIHKVNPWFTYGMPLHRMREFGFTFPEMDEMNQKTLSVDQMAVVCTSMFETKDPWYWNSKLYIEARPKFPNVRDNFDAFLAVLRRANAQNSSCYSVVLNKPRHWIDIPNVSYHYNPRNDEALDGSNVNMLLHQTITTICQGKEIFNFDLLVTVLLSPFLDFPSLRASIDSMPGDYSQHGQHCSFDEQLDLFLKDVQSIHMGIPSSTKQLIETLASRAASSTYPKRSSIGRLFDIYQEAMQMALAEALKQDKRRSRRSRLMIIGEGRAGKSSLLRAFTNQSFNQEQVSTAGLDLHDFFAVREAGAEVSDITNWQTNNLSESERCLRQQAAANLQKKRDIQKLEAKMHHSEPMSETRLRRQMAKMHHSEPMSETPSRRRANAPTTSSAPVKHPHLHDPYPSASHSTASTAAKTRDFEEESFVPKAGKTKRGGGFDVIDTEREKGIEEDVAGDRGDLTMEIDGLSSKEAEALTFSVWDYGGQRVFQAVQHLFITRQGVFLLIFDMSRLLSENIAVRENALDYLRFWLRQVYLLAEGAPLTLVGTHKDIVSNEDSWRTISALLDNTFGGSDSNERTVWNFVTRNSDQDLAFFPVDNSARLPIDENIIKLKALVQKQAEEDKLSPSDLTGYVNEQLPLSWLKFCDVLRLKSKTTPHVQLQRDNEEEEHEDAYSIALRCGVFKGMMKSDIPNKLRRLRLVLERMFQMGIVVYFDDDERLKNIVVLDPQWLLDRITFVVRDFRLHRFSRDMNLIKKQQKNWQALTLNGILSASMLEDLWLGEHQRERDFMLQFMDKVGLLCPSPHVDDDGFALYFVPSVVTASDTSSSSSSFSSSSSSSSTSSSSSSSSLSFEQEHCDQLSRIISATFVTPVPEGFFARLVVGLARLHPSIINKEMDVETVLIPRFISRGEDLSLLITPPCVSFCESGRANDDGTSINFAVLVVANELLLLRPPLPSSNSINIMVAAKKDSSSRLPSDSSSGGLAEIIERELLAINEDFYRKKLDFAIGVSEVRGGDAVAAGGLPVDLWRLVQRKAGSTTSLLETTPPLHFLKRQPKEVLGHVSDFSVFRRGVGKVTWESSVDLVGIDIEQAVDIFFDKSSGRPVISLYRDVMEAPSLGSGLNKPALCTLNIDLQNKTSEQIQRQCSESMGVEFISYDAEKKELTYRVQSWFIQQASFGDEDEAEQIASSYGLNVGLYAAYHSLFSRYLHEEAKLGYGCHSAEEEKKHVKRNRSDEKASLAMIEKYKLDSRLPLEFVNEATADDELKTLSDQLAWFVEKVDAIKDEREEEEEGQEQREKYGRLETYLRNLYALPSIHTLHEFLLHIQVPSKNAFHYAKLLVQNGDLYGNHESLVQLIDIFKSHSSESFKVWLADTIGIVKEEHQKSLLDGLDRVTNLADYQGRMKLVCLGCFSVSPELCLEAIQMKLYGSKGLYFDQKRTDFEEPRKDLESFLHYQKPSVLHISIPLPLPSFSSQSEDLASTILEAKDTIECVIINTPSSRELAKLLHDGGIKTVIYWSSAFDRTALVIFTEALYFQISSCCCSSSGSFSYLTAYAAAKTEVEQGHYYLFQDPAAQETENVLKMARRKNKKTAVAGHLQILGGNTKKSTKSASQKLQAEKIDKILANQEAFGHKLDDAKALLVGLSEQQRQSFDVQLSLCRKMDSLAAHVKLGDSRFTEGLSSLRRVIDDKSADTSSKLQHLEKMSVHLGEDVSTQIKSILGDVTRRDGDKLNVIISSLNRLEASVSRMQQSLKDVQHLTRALEARSNNMPRTFVLVPKPEISPLPRDAWYYEKVANAIQRKVTSKVTRLLWKETRLIFVCPVTMKKVICGPNRKALLERNASVNDPENGYEISLPTEALRAIVPVLKFGMYLLKIGLATQGLGGFVPPVEDFLPDMNDDFLNAVKDDLGAKFDDADAPLENIDSTLDAQQKRNDEEALKIVFDLVAKAEKYDGKDVNWKPKQTGLVVVTCEATSGASMWIAQDDKDAQQEYARRGREALGSIGSNLVQEGDGLEVDEGGGGGGESSSSGGSSSAVSASATRAPATPNASIGGKIGAHIGDAQKTGNVEHSSVCVIN